MVGRVLGIGLAAVTVDGASRDCVYRSVHSLLHTLVAFLRFADLPVTVREKPVVTWNGRIKPTLTSDAAQSFSRASSRINSRICSCVRGRLFCTVFFVADFFESRFHHRSMLARTTVTTLLNVLQ